MDKGSIVLVPFPFTDLSGKKLRPAVILIDSEYDITVCFITTQMKWKEISDIEIIPTVENGIKKTSLIRLSKIATLSKPIALGKLGALNHKEIKELNLKLMALFQLK